MEPAGSTETQVWEEEAWASSPEGFSRADFQALSPFKTEYRPEYYVECLDCNCLFIGLQQTPISSYLQDRHADMRILYYSWVRLWANLSHVDHVLLFSCENTV